MPPSPSPTPASSPTSPPARTPAATPSPTSAPASPASGHGPLPDWLFVDLPRLAADLEAVADDLAQRSRASRAGFASVQWDGEARAMLDAHLDRLDADLVGLVAEIRSSAADIRRDASTATS